MQEWMHRSCIEACSYFYESNARLEYSACIQVDLPVKFKQIHTSYM
jgi:hypothetical protein